MSRTPESVIAEIKRFLAKDGLEAHPFKIGWYNDSVSAPFKFSYNPDTLAIVVISTPSMFEDGFLPFLLRDECTGTGDLLDNYLKEKLQEIKEMFPDCDVEGMHDFELLPSRRPRVLVQTAGHVAGAAYYYQRADVQPDPWTPDTKIFGVSIHPEYGGWFALRGVLILKNIVCPDLPLKEPVDIVPSTAQRRELLERFNFRWQDWTFRDIIPVNKRYSEQQKVYFATPPKDRHPFIQTLKVELKQNVQ